MSQENVEIVKAAYEAVNSGDEERLLALAASDIEIQASGVMLDQGTYRGHEGAVAYRESLREAWGDSLHIQPVDFTAQRDHVVVTGRTSGTGKSSGAEVDIPVAHAWTIRAGEIVRFQTFRSHAEALEAVGLSEQDAHADS